MDWGIYSVIALGRTCRMFEQWCGRVSCSVTYPWLLQTNPVTHPLPDSSGSSIFFPKLMKLTDTQITKHNVTANISGYQICISKYTWYMHMSENDFCLEGVFLKKTSDRRFSFIPGRQIISSHRTLETPWISGSFSRRPLGNPGSGWKQ